MKVRHPRLSHVLYEVHDSHVDRWVDAGWVVDGPEPVAPVGSFLTLDTFEFSDDDDS